MAYKKTSTSAVSVSDLVGKAKVSDKNGTETVEEKKSSSASSFAKTEDDKSEDKEEKVEEPAAPISSRVHVEQQRSRTKTILFIYSTTKRSLE